MGPDAKDSLAYRRALVDTLRRDSHLRSPRVESALLAVPRELFVPGVPLDEVYRPSDAIVTKRVDGVSVSSASAPEVIALMLEQLDPRPGERVLEIGAGTGYNAALLAHMVGGAGRVITIDIDEDLVLSARAHLADAGYRSVSVVQADGALGYPEQSARSYDRIILTVASSDIPPAWREQLARPHGRLVMPLALRGLQRCVAFQTDGECLIGASPRACSFIGLRGLLGMAPPRVPLDQEGNWTLGGDDELLPLDPATVGQLLARPMRARPTGISTSLEEVRLGLHLWLAAHDPYIYTVWAAARLPDLFGLTDRAGARGTLCLLDAATAGASLAVLAWADESACAGELCILTPEGGEASADRLQGLLAEWVTAGRPTDAALAIHACARTSPEAESAAQAAAPDDVRIDQRWTRFTLRWTRTV